VLPVGAGLLAFTGPAEAAAALDEVEPDHARHGRDACARRGILRLRATARYRLLADAMSAEITAPATVVETA
jgi:hypothetical protein